MSEPFIKLNMWMASELNLSGNELIIFAVIHSYTEYKGGYDGGASQLGKWAGVSRQNVYRYLAPLIERGYVEAHGTGGRKPTVYVSKASNRLKLRQLKNMSDEPTVSNRDSKPSQIETPIDIIDDCNINNTPLYPPTDNIDDILSSASLGIPKYAEQEQTIHDRIREMWAAPKMTLGGKRVNRQQIRETLRKLDRQRAFDIWTRLKRAEVHGQIQTEPREYYYTTIYNALSER